MAEKTGKLSKRRPKQDRSKATIEVILRASAHILESEGYPAFSTNHIAQIAGVSVGSIYQYFATKERILAVLIERHFDKLDSLFEKTMNEVIHAPMELATREVIRTMLAVHVVNPKLHRVLNEQIPKVGQSARFEKHHRHGMKLLRQYLEAHKNDLRIRNLDLGSLLIIKAMDSIVHSVVHD